MCCVLIFQVDESCLWKVSWYLTPSLVSMFHQLEFRPFAFSAGPSILACIQFSSLLRFVFDVFGLIFGLTDLDRFCDWSSKCWLVLLSMEGCSKDGFWSCCWFCKLSMVSSSDSDSVLGVVFLPLLSGCSYVSWFMLFCEFVGSVCFFCIDCWTSQVFFSSRKRHGWTLIYVLRCFTRTWWPSWSVTLPGPCHSLLK